MSVNPYHSIFKAILSALPAGKAIDLAPLLATSELPKVSLATRKKHLKALVRAEPELLERIVGFYPSVDTVIDLVEIRHGKVLEVNLDQSNEHCRSIVEKIGRPIILGFVQATLAEHISGTKVALTLDELMDFLLDEFTDFARGAGNGLVSIAGSMNEQLLMRAMANAGLKANEDFRKTGTNSEADFVVHSHIGNKDNLGVEVKSYHARERLLRGLRDVTGLKVGVGYFKDASEFNKTRTVTLLQTDPAAIYIPTATLKNVDPAAQSIPTNSKIAFQSRLYRPIERFVSDMAHFCKKGELPKY